MHSGNYKNIKNSYRFHFRTIFQKKNTFEYIIIPLILLSTQ